MTLDNSVTAERLLSMGFRGTDNCYPLEIRTGGVMNGIAVSVVNPRFTVWFVNVGDRFHQIPAIRTCGEVQRLCQALGIPLEATP